MNLSEVTHRADDAAAVAVAAAAAATLETVESFGIGYGQGAGASTGDWMKPPGDLFLYSTLDMKDLTGAVGDMVLFTCCLFVAGYYRSIRSLRNRARLATFQAASWRRVAYS